jgi:hypothetical protein
LRHLTLLEEEIRADGSPDGVLDALLERSGRSAEPVVVVGSQKTLSVEIGPPSVG